MENFQNSEQHRYEKARKRVKTFAAFYKHLMVYIVVNAFLIILKWVRLDPGENFFEFSTFATALFWGIGLALHALSVFGPEIMFGQNWEDKKVRELMDKEKNNKWQ